MNDPRSRGARPSPWAVALFVFSSVVAVVSMALVSTTYGAF